MLWGAPLQTAATLRDIIPGSFKAKLQKKPREQKSHILPIHMQSIKLKLVVLWCFSWEEAFSVGKLPAVSPFCANRAWNTEGRPEQTTARSACSSCLIRIVLTLNSPVVWPLPIIAITCHWSPWWPPWWRLPGHSIHFVLPFKSQPLFPLPPQNSAAQHGSVKTYFARHDFCWDFNLKWSLNALTLCILVILQPCWETNNEEKVALSPSYSEAW